MTVVVLGLIGWALGIDPRVLIGGAEMMSRTGEPQHQSNVGSTTPGTPSDAMGKFVSAILGSTEAEWGDIFRSGRAKVRTANAGHVFRSNSVRLRACASGDGSVLLPD